MTEPNSSTLQKHGPDEPRARLGPTLSAASEPCGKTTIADGVVEKMAGIAAREVPGINALDGGFPRSMGAMPDWVPGGRPSAGRGVKVEVGEKQTAIGLQVVVEYGVSISDVAAEVRENGITAVERMTGLEVVEVNIAVNDVHLPDETHQRPAKGACSRAMPQKLQAWSETDKYPNRRRTVAQFEHWPSMLRPATVVVLCPNAPLGGALSTCPRGPRSGT